MNRKGLYIIAGMVAGALVVVAVVVPCVLLIPADENDTRTNYTFEDLYSTKYNYKSLYPTWDKTDDTNRNFITRNSDGSIVLRDVTKHETDVKTLINSEGDGKTSSYVVSADNMFVYYRDNTKKVWRHSYTADYVIYKIVDGNLAGVRVTPTNFPSDGMVHHMEWSPTGHKLAYVYMWDIYVVDNLEAGTPTIKRITSDGAQNKIYNGIPDWVYEEEMISSNNVLYWAPDSSSFAYLKTDDTNTNIIKYSMYNEAQYPETIEIAYPKAGTTNPTVKFYVSDLTAGSNGTELVPKGAIENFAEYYFSRFTWLDASTCLVTWIDRNQTHSVANQCTKSGANWDCSTTGTGYEEKVDGGWVGSFGPFNIVWKEGAANKEYFTIYARADETDAEDGRWQIAHVSEANTATRTWKTKTAFDIIGLYFYDSANDYLYFTAAAPEPRQRNVYRIKGSDTDRADPECMTCYLNKNKYENRCGWITPVFNIDRSLVVINCRGYWVPMTATIEINSAGDWQSEVVIEDNRQLQDLVADTKWPVKSYGTFKSAKYSKAYQYEIFKPADFDPNRKYPLLVEVYAGPEFQSVTDVWTRGWATTHMVSDKDIIVASVDGRGSAYEGYKFMRQVYHKLGQFEPEDQTDFANYLIQENDWIDGDHVAIWGWSYGGYTTSHTLGHDGGNTFKCGIAVAPLADWRYYDSMYAERYMGWPESNKDGYDKASIIEAHDLANFKKAEYVLIHGTADDNVHFQNAAEMEKALVEADVDFDDFFYADQAHSINIGNANKHIYRQLTTRMSHCLGRSNVVYPGVP